jgi:hypothetical protein
MKTLLATLLLAMTANAFSLDYAQVKISKKPGVQGNPWMLTPLESESIYGNVLFPMNEESEDFIAGMDRKVKAYSCSVKFANGHEFVKIYDIKDCTVLK